MVWIQDGVPVVGKEDPGGDQKAVYLPARADRLGQAVQFGFREYSPIMKEPTGDEEETIRQYETAQARHDTDYNPTPSTKEQRKNQTLEPQSLKKPNSALQKAYSKPKIRFPRNPRKISLTSTCQQHMLAKGMKGSDE